MTQANLALLQGLADVRDHGETSRPVKSPQPASVSAYIGEMTAELAGMARQAELDVLAYLLDIARLEAETTARSRKD